MASDSFTNTNGTPLASHTAGGNTWAGVGQVEAAGVIQNNTVLADVSEWFQVSGRATNSTESYSQIVFKAGDYGDESKAVHVRADATQQGYWLHCTPGPTGDTFSSLALRKGENYLSGATVSMNRLVDNTVAIKATTVGSDVQIEAWLNGNQLTFNESLPGFEGPPSTIFTDTAANSPILSGNPGFTCHFFDDITAANSAFDDWTDTQSAAGYTLTAEQGSYILVGSDALVDREINGDQGTYTVTGQAANLLRNRRMFADAGSYVLTGQQADLVYSGAGPKIITADQGTYTVVGQQATLRRAARLVAESGTYNLQGFAVVGGTASDSGSNSGGVFKVRKALVVSTTGRTRWVHYIPVKQVPTTAPGRYDNQGAVEVELLGSGAGLTEWVDYIPIVEVADGDAGKWRYDNAGWIPILIVE